MVSHTHIKCSPWDNEGSILIKIYIDDSAFDYKVVYGYDEKWNWWRLDYDHIPRTEETIINLVKEKSKKLQHSADEELECRARAIRICNIIKDSKDV